MVKEDKIQKPTAPELNIYDHLAPATKFSVGDEVYIKQGKFKDYKGTVLNIRQHARMQAGIDGNQYPIKTTLYAISSETNPEILRTWFPEESLAKYKKWVFF